MTTRTQDVRAQIVTGGEIFSPTSITLELAWDRGASHLKAKGLMENPDHLRLNGDVILNINREFVFRGNLKEATQNEEGIITLHAYDVLVDTYMKTVKLDTEELRRGTTVARDLLSEAAIPHEIAPPWRFPSQDPPGKYRFGSGRAGEPLGNVLHSIAQRIGGVIYVDRSNTLNLVPAVERNHWRPQHIVTMDAGKSQSKKTKVLVNSESNVTEDGMASAWIFSRIGAQGRAEIEEPDNVEGENLKTLNEPNIVTQNEANNRAISEIFSESMAERAGSMTIVGDPRVRPWDDITMPFLPDTMVSRETFTAGTVTHTMNMQDGYKTKVELQPEVLEVLEKIRSTGSIDSRVYEWGNVVTSDAQKLELHQA